MQNHAKDFYTKPIRVCKDMSRADQPKLSRSLLSSSEKVGLGVIASTSTIAVLIVSVSLTDLSDVD